MMKKMMIFLTSNQHKKRYVIFAFRIVTIFIMNLVVDISIIFLAYKSLSKLILKKKNYLFHALKNNA